MATTTDTLSPKVIADKEEVTGAAQAPALDLSEPIPTATATPKFVRMISTPQNVPVNAKQMQLNCDVRFSCPKLSPAEIKRRKKEAKENEEPYDYNAELEMIKIRLSPGSDNRIPYDDYMAVLSVKNSPFKAAIEGFPPSIKAIFPIPGIEEADLTTDFNASDAVEIIRESYDIEWLKLCAPKDDRPGMTNVINQRLVQLDRNEKAIAIRANAIVAQQDANSEILFQGNT
jgi:hypothetical protein